MDTEVFLSALMKNLLLAKKKYPKTYTWQNADVLDVFRRFADSLREGTYSRHVHPIKWTCAELGMPCTREAIDALFATESTGQKIHFKKET